MAVGDDALAAGYPLVQGTDMVRYGAEEINRTRDILAGVQDQIPLNKGAYRAAGGITYGYGDPTGGDNGDIYFKIVN